MQLTNIINFQIPDEKILAPQQTATLSRIQEKQVVLAVQDTTFPHFP